MQKILYFFFVFVFCIKKVVYLQCQTKTKNKMIATYKGIHSGDYFTNGEQYKVTKMALHQFKIIDNLWIERWIQKSNKFFTLK